jgi:hypothetical protein
MTINFYQIEEAQLLSYHYYSAQVSSNDLLDLNSYKLRNIISIVFNSRIKDLFLDDLFNQNGTLLPSETKDNLFKHFSSHELNDLKNYLSTYLDFQIESNWYNTLSQVLKIESLNTIIIPSLILHQGFLLAELKSLFPKKKFVDWNNYNETDEALILDYNHAWKRRNLFTLQESNNKAYFLKHFFESTYQRKVFNDEKHLFNRINTQTRELILGKELLTETKEKLDSIRPENAFNEWDILHESNHKYSFTPQEEIVIYFTPTNSNKYRLSASFLLLKDGKYSIQNAKDLVSSPGDFEGKYEFSNLENIIAQVDLSKINKAIEKDKSISQIIQPLWTKFNLNEIDGRLWKQLLKRKVTEHGINKVFYEIEGLSGVNQFVSLNTFENTYCNPMNNTIIPREKKVFKAICKYLKLPLEYRAAIHRERNLTGGNSQELHSKLKDFIVAIVENGVLDNHKNEDQLLNIPNQVVDKIENRVDMEFFGFTRDALVYAGIEICFEVILRMKQKPILKIEHFIHN